MRCRKSGIGIVSRVTPVHTAVRNCTRDEGRPFEVFKSTLPDLTLSAQKLQPMP
jgi:hypothetical protein